MKDLTMTFVKALTVGTLLASTLIATGALAKGHNNGVQEVVAAVKAGDLTIGLSGIGNTAPVAPGDGDAADTEAVDRNSREYTSQGGNPGRDGTLPGLKR
jgi:hypothetical protein